MKLDLEADSFVLLMFVSPKKRRFLWTQAPFSFGRHKRPNEVQKTRLYNQSPFNYFTYEFIEPM